MDNVASLESLPAELACLIFCLLDPPSLVAISQTSSALRVLINPTTTLFVDRLLVLETLEDAGGLAPMYHPGVVRTRELRASWEPRNWERKLWACSSCLRLLPHVHFDNHSLLRLRYRKPETWSDAAGIVSSWKPTPRVSSSLLTPVGSESALHSLSCSTPLHGDDDKRETLGPSRKGVRKERKKTQSSAFSEKNRTPKDRLDPAVQLALFQKVNWEDFGNISLENFVLLTQTIGIALQGMTAEAVERVYCGAKRRLRRCNECRFQRGEFQTHISQQLNRGTNEVPLIRSRQFSFSSPLERYFPEFRHRGLDARIGEFPLLRPLAMRALSDYGAWTMHMVRCGRCSRWQELREFRGGGAYCRWKPDGDGRNWDGAAFNRETVAGMICNSCFAAKHGRSALRVELVRMWDFMASKQLRSLEHRLAHGWASIEVGLEALPWGYRPMVEKKILKSVPWTDPASRGLGINVHKADFKSLGEKRRQLAEIFRNAGVLYHTFPAQNRFGPWMSEYHLLEKQWEWYRDEIREVEKRPDILVEWALSRNPSVLA